MTAKSALLIIVGGTILSMLLAFAIYGGVAIVKGQEDKELTSKVLLEACRQDGELCEDLQELAGADVVCGTSYLPNKCWVEYKDGLPF